MLVFDPNIGLKADDISDVREIVRQDWINAFQKDGEPILDTDPETPAGQLIDSATQHIVEKDNEILFLANQFNPLTAEGIWQDALGKIYFLTRKQHQHSVCICTLTGVEGTIIPIGARIKSTADSTTWICSSEITIPPSGNIDAQFVCEDYGPITAGAGTLTSISTIVPGWDEVYNKTAAIAGRYTETQMEFENRRYNSVSANARGSMASIYAALNNIENVVDCVVLENTTNNPITTWGVEIPGHSIYVSITGGAEAEIAEKIYQKKDAGCGTAGNTTITYQDLEIPGEPIYTYKIERPTPIDFGIRVTIKVTDQTPNNIEALIKEALIADFSGNGPHNTLRIGTAQTVYASRFYCCVIESGANGLEKIEIACPLSGNSWGDTVTISADQTPVLDEKNIEIIQVKG